MRGLTRRSFFALLAGVVVMPKIKAQAQPCYFNEKLLRDRLKYLEEHPEEIRKYPLTPEECYRIACDPIGPYPYPSPSMVIWKTSRRNGRLSRITSEGKIEKGDIVWKKAQL